MIQIASFTDAQADERRLAEPKRKRQAIAISAASLAFALYAIALYWWVFPKNWAPDIPVQCFGLVWIVTGYLAWTRLRKPRIGLIIVCMGAAYYLRDLRASSNMVIFGAGFCLDFLWLAVCAHLVLSYPEGRVKGRGSQLLVASCYAAVIITQSVRLIIDHPSRPIGDNTAYTPTPASVTASVLAIVYFVVFTVVVLRRWRRASAVRRRSRAPVWAAIVLLVVPGTAGCLASILREPLYVQDGLNSVALGAAVLLLPAILMVQSANGKRVLLRLAGVLDPARIQFLKNHPESLQQVLADAIGDPLLKIAYPTGGDQYVNIEGHPVFPDFPAAGRTVTRVTQQDSVTQEQSLVAVIEHDDGVNDQHDLKEIVVTVAGVAIDIARTHAKLRGQIEETKTSRLRISEAAFSERRRIEHDIHDGAQQRFLTVLLLLGGAIDKLGTGSRDEIREILEQARDMQDDAIVELRELARGIYPASLTDGLAAAVHAIAYDMTTLTVSIEVDIPPTRWDERLEITSYFLIAEAIANATKYAQATCITVQVHELDARLRIDVSDNGVGGMQNKPKGLADRVHTMDGELTFSSSPGKGTTIHALLPLQRR